VDYYTLFQPVLRLHAKLGCGDRIMGRWERAQPPLRRLLATTVLSPEQRQRLQRLRAALNPRSLRQPIYQELARLLGQEVPRSAWEPAG